jgi:hypothetical protein
MAAVLDYNSAAVIVAVVASTFCWWHIRRSGDPFLVKFVLALIVAVPYLGALIYVLVQLPPRRYPPAPPEGGDASPYVIRWHAREHIYLGWASAVFWGLAGVAYWMNDWSPGPIIQGRFGAFTQVDVIFHALLAGAIVTFGLAVRAKVILERALIGTYTLAHQRHLETQ